jgi:hypothetical protein
LDEAVRAGPHSSAGAIEGSEGALRWHWFHAGGAHHLTTRVSPGSWENFFADDAWIGLVFGHLERLASDGWSFATVSELGTALQRGRGIDALPEMPQVVDGGWEPRSLECIRRWTGGQRGAWPGAQASIGAVWRARKALREAESAPADGPDAGDFRLAWRSQVLAESSRGGLGPTNLRHADAVLQRCAPLAWAGGANGDLDRQASRTRVPAPVTAELVGAVGQVAWYRRGPGLYGCEAAFTSDAPDHGLRFRREPGAVCYCPSGMEGRPVVTDLSGLRPQTVYLPLANGLLGLGPQRFLIRLNESCSHAVAVSRDGEWASFLVDGGPENRPYEWAFALFEGPLEHAVAAANRLNRI